MSHPTGPLKGEMHEAETSSGSTPPARQECRGSVKERSNPVALKGQRKAVNAKKARRLIGKRLAVWAGSARMSRNSGNRRVVSTESTRRAARDDARGFCGPRFKPRDHARDTPTQSVSEGSELPPNSRTVSRHLREHANSQQHMSTPSRAAFHLAFSSQQFHSLLRISNCTRRLNGRARPGAVQSSAARETVLRAE